MSDQVIPRWSKISYELVFLYAIMDMRKARAEKPESWANYVIALKEVLLPSELKKIVDYELDISHHKQELEALEMRLKDVQDFQLRNKIRLNDLKKISFPLYCREIDELYKSKKLEDKNFDNVVDKVDVVIMKYEALAEKIIEILKEGDWLIKSSKIEIGGGGIGFDEPVI